MNHLLDAVGIVPVLELAALLVEELVEVEVEASIDQDFAFVVGALVEVVSTGCVEVIVELVPLVSVSRGLEDC